MALADDDNDVFAPPDGTWVRLHPNYLKSRRIGVLIKWPVFFLLMGVALWWFTGSRIGPLICLATAPFWIAFQYFRQRRVFHRWGFAERETDLYVCHGLMFRQLTVIPYGRMQIVEVNSGPIDRFFGLASVEFITAGPKITVPGLSEADAGALRDRLSRYGREQQAGL